MIIAEADTQILQAWLERRLATISDAEAPILAEYCIALLNHDQPPEEVRRVCIEQLNDFLRDDTTRFVDEVFEALRTRAFVDARSQVGAAQIQAVAPPVVTAQIQAVAPPVVTATHAPPPPYSRQDDDSAMMVDQQTEVGRDYRQRKPCFTYQRTGQCSRGAACRYEHVPAPDDHTPRSTERRPRTEGPQRHRGPQHDRTKSTLIVENIPGERLDTTAVQQYFGQFGEIQQIDLDTREKRAIVKFADWESANRAWTSPAAVFDNRFVKVFWRQEDRPVGSSANPAPVAPQVDLAPEAVAQRQQAHEERMRKKQEMESRMAAVRAQQMNLLNKQAENESRLAQMSGQAPAPGSSTAALEAQLNELKAKAAALGVPRPAPSRGGGARGRGGFVGGRGAGGRGRGALRASPYAGRPMTLDNRPRKVVVDEFDVANSAALKQHIMQQPDCESVEDLRGKPVVTFKSRHAAERFFASRDIDGVGRVSMSWLSNGTGQAQSNGDVDMRNERLDD